MTGNVNSAAADPQLGQFPKKVCRECGDQIPEPARKCATCGAYQDWRRVFWLGNSTLSLLVALFSVLTVAVPILKRALTPEYERVTVQVVTQRYEPSLEKNVMVVHLANSGTVAAFISPNANLFANKRKAAFSIDLLPRGPRDGTATRAGVSGVADLLVEPSGQRILFAAHPESTPTINDPELNDTCELVITVYRLDGSKRDETHAYRCYNPGLST